MILNHFHRLLDKQGRRRNRKPRAPPKPRSETTVCNGAEEDADSQGNNEEPPVADASAAQDSIRPVVVEDVRVSTEPVSADNQSTAAVVPSDESFPETTGRSKRRAG